MLLFWRMLIGKFLENQHELVCVVPPGDADSEKQLRALGASIINYPLDRKGLNPVRDYQTYAFLKSLFLREKPELLFTSTIKSVIYGCLAAKSAHIPSIFAAITGLGYVFEANSALKKIIHMIGVKLYRRALNGISGIFFQNRDDRELFQKLGLINRLPAYLEPGTGVDLNKFTPAPFPEEPIRFLLIARLLEAKGLREYAEAAKMLARKWPNAQFQLLGPPEQGPGSISVRELENWQNDGAIHYHGQTSDVRPYIANSHVAVLPSWREGVPTSVMEAMAMGRPVVLANSPGCRELLEEGENGFFSSPRNEDSLACAMEKFLADPALIPQMGKRSREIVCERFDAQKVAASMFHTMLDNARPFWEVKHP